LSLYKLGRPPAPDKHHATCACDTAVT
jgi:hypothetical protein